MFTGSTKNPPPKSPQPDRLDEVYAALRRGLQSYLQVHQLELDSLGQQIRESKRNGRLGFLYELDKQVKAIERFMRRLEFHLSKVEELYDAYCMQRRLRDGASKMVAAFNSASGSKEARESLSEANRGYREYTEHMCSLECELEGQMGEFHIKMKGLAGFARLCAGDQYEVLMRAGRQRWRLRGRVEGSGRQVWDSEEYVFLPLVTELLSIKVTELKSLANHVVVGSVSCETLDLFCPLPQTVAVDINDLGTVKLNLEVTWSPFDKDDQTSSASTISKRFLSNQSPPDTPSMREQVFYSSPRSGALQRWAVDAFRETWADRRSPSHSDVTSTPLRFPRSPLSLLKRQGELENGTVWSNSSESSDDSSSPAMGHHGHRMMATPTLQTTPTIQISFNPRRSSASTPSLSSPRGEDAADGLGEGNSGKWTMPNGHSRSLSHIDDTSIDSIVTERPPLAQSPGSPRIPEPLGQSHPEASCSGQKSEAWDLPECGAPEGFRGDPEELVGVTQASAVLQAQKPGAGVEAVSADGALGEGKGEEQSSPKDNQRHQATQPLGQGLRLPGETLKGRSHSRSSSFTQDIETALESFDFLNGSDLEDGEGEEEELEAKEELKEKEEEEEEEQKEKEEEEVEELKTEEEDQKEELKEKVEKEKEELKEKEEEKEEELEVKEEGEELEEKKEEEEEEELNDAESQECEEEIEIFMEAPEGFRNCDCVPSDEDDCLSQTREDTEEEASWREVEAKKEEEQEEGKEKEKEEREKAEKEDKKEDQEVEKDKDEEEKPQNETDEEGEVTEMAPSKQQLVEMPSPDEEARPLTPAHMATTVL